MSEQFLGSPPSDRSKQDEVALASRGFGFAGHDLHEPALASNGDTAADVADVVALEAREQLARDIADIERAAAALRRAAPTLQSWSKPANMAAPKPRPLWLLIGALWLSTALVTVGAVYAVALLAG